MESTSVKVSDFDKVCRICLSKEILYPIFVSIYKKEALSCFFASCTSIHVDKDDKLPKNVCSVCLQQIIIIHDFQEKCRQSANILNFVLSEVDVVKQEFDEIVIKEELTTNLSDSEKEPLTKLEEKPEKSKTFLCRVCSKEFATKNELRNHQKEVKHVESEKRKCAVCDKEFARSYLREHMLVHAEKRPFKCSLCPQSFSFKHCLKRHTMKHTGERPYVCEICGKGFTQNSYLQVHVLSRHPTCHGEDNPQFVCSVCGKTFPANSILQKHQRLHTAKKPHTCKVCAKLFAFPSLLQTHMLSHTQQKVHRCKHCPKAFTQMAHLNRHLHTHSGERPFSCHYCGKSFGLKGTLTVHIRTHTGEKPFECTVCGKGFRTSSDMKVHQRRNHKDGDGFVVETQIKHEVL